MPTLDPQAVNLAKAIRQTESGGDFAASGKSGEYGAYQYTEPTWAKDSVAAGINVPLKQSTKEQQNQVAYTKIKSLKDQGYNPGQIASVWNSGNPEAYKDPTYKGTNKSGVHFDVPAYAESVAKAYQTLKSGGQVGVDPQKPSSIAAAQSQPKETSQEQGLGSQLEGRAKDALGAITEGVTGKINPLSGILQTVGAGAGAVGDVIGAGLGLIPGVKKAEQLVGKGIGKLASTSIGQKVVGGAQDFAEKHPELSKDIGAVGNIAGLYYGGVGGKLGATAAKQGLETAAKEGILGATVKGAVEKSYMKAATKALETNPKLTDVKSGIKSAALSTEKGIPTLGEDAAKRASIEQVAQGMKEGVIPKKGLKTDIALASERAAVGESKALEKALSSSDVLPTVQPEQINQMLQNIDKRAGQSLVSGENPAKVLMNKFIEHLPKDREILPVDILKARRAVGSFIKEMRGDWSQRGVMTGFKSARDAFWDESRDLLKSIAPVGVDVEGSLAKQTALYRVADYIAPAVKKELGTTKFGRFVEKHPYTAGLIKNSIKGTAHALAPGVIGGLIAHHLD